MAIENEGDVLTFAYSGGVQVFTAPHKGVYKLECWGAQGGGDYGGKGGYSYGHALLEKGAKVYVCCGQAGASWSTATTYNGGGGTTSKYLELTEHYKPTTSGASGGGATHMATMDGTLSAIGSGNLASVLLVAGGGGGRDAPSSWDTSTQTGGTGGGASGGTSTKGSFSAAGGTQTGGYAFGQGQTGCAIYADRTGDNNYANRCAGGGGGGLYGGYARTDSGSKLYEVSYDCGFCGGGGGSGYTGGVPELAYRGETYGCGMENGLRAGNGCAQITFVKKGELPVRFDGAMLQRITMNGTEVKGLIFNGVRVFCRWMKGRWTSWLSGFTARALRGRAGTAQA